MAFSLVNFDKGSAEGNTSVRRVYSYLSSTDSLATISVADYFLPVYQKLRAGDDIMVMGSDGHDRLVVVASSSTTVTTSTAPDVAPGSITNVDIAANAAIAYSKLAALTDANILVGSATNVATVVAVTGDVTISNAGVTAIAADVIVNADVKTDAAIAYSKLAPLTSAQILVGSAGNVASAVAMSGDVAIDNSGATTIQAAAVDKAMLAVTVRPSHMIVFSDQLTTVGGAATEAFTVTGAVGATDRAFVQVVADGTGNVTVLQAVVTNDTLTIEFSANPGADTIFNYQLVRATS